MDKNGRLFGKINIIDLCVILLILALIAAAGFRFLSPSMARDAESRVRYVIVLEGVRDFTLDYYSKGLSVWDARQQQHIGNIHYFWYEPHIDFVEMLDGTVAPSHPPGVIDIFIEVEAFARITPTAILIGGARQLTVGSIIHINTRYIDVEGIIMSFQILD